MTHRDAEDFSRKHPAGEKADALLAEAIARRAKDGTIACTSAFEIASERGASPSDVGRTIDLVNVRLVKCQLGLFGYPPQGKAVKPAETVSPDLERAVRKRLREGRLACAEAWEIAKDLKVKKMDVASAAEKLGIKIKPCQLGAF